MNFIDAVNRLLRIEHVIQGDDDNITLFTDNNHAADISLSQIAIQDELAELTSDRLVPYEKTSDTITLVSGTREYELNTNFIRFFGKPSFYDAIDNRRIYEYPGGEECLMHIDYQYKTTTGTPVSWYFENASTKKVAFYNIPNDAYNNRALSYDYEKSIMITNETDTVPFHTNEECYAFIDMAARRFHYMITNKERGTLSADATYENAKARLYNLLSYKNPTRFYGRKYR